MLNNDYDFNDRSYELAVRDLKAVMFDIILDDKNDLASIQKVIAGIGENVVAELKELYDKKSSVLKDVLANTNQLVNDLKKLDLYSSKLVEVENRLGIANALVDEAETEKSTSLNMSVPIANEVELATNNVDNVESSNSEPVDASAVEPEASNLEQAVLPEATPSVADSTQTPENVIPEPAADTSAVEPEASNLEQAVLPEATPSVADSTQTPENVIPEPVADTSTVEPEASNAIKLDDISTEVIPSDTVAEVGIPDFMREGINEDKAIIVSAKQNDNLLSSRDTNEAKFNAMKDNLIYVQKNVNNQILPAVSEDNASELVQQVVDSSTSETMVEDKREIMTQQATQLYSEGKTEEAKALLDEVAALNQQYQANEGVAKAV